MDKKPSITTVLNYLPKSFFMVHTKQKWKGNFSLNLTLKLGIFWKWLHHLSSHWSSSFFMFLSNSICKQRSLQISLFPHIFLWRLVLLPLATLKTPHILASFFFKHSIHFLIFISIVFLSYYYLFDFLPSHNFFIYHEEKRSRAWWGKYECHFDTFHYLIMMALYRDFLLYVPLNSFSFLSFWSLWSWQQCFIYSFDRYSSRKKKTKNQRIKNEMEKKVG